MPALPSIFGSRTSRCRDACGLYSVFCAQRVSRASNMYRSSRNSTWAYCCSAIAIIYFYNYIYSQANKMCLQSEMENVRINTISVWPNLETIRILK